MPTKKNGKALQLNGEVLLNFRRAIKAEGFRHGVTARVEDILEKYTKKVFKKFKIEWIRDIPVIKDEDVRVKGGVQEEKKYGT